MNTYKDFLPKFVLTLQNVNIYLLKCMERQFLTRNYTPRKPSDDLHHTYNGPATTTTLLLLDAGEHLTLTKLNLVIL